MATDVDLIGKDRNYERWRWQIFFITWLAYAGFYLTRKGFTVAKIELADMGWTKGDFAWVDFAYLSAYAVGQFIWGIAGDKLGTRIVILTGMLASVLTAVAMGASSTIVVLGLLFAVQGLCQSTGWAPLAKNMGNFFSQHERGRVMGFWCTNYAMGGLIASALAGFAIEWAGQQRLAEYQPEQRPSLEAVEKVAASQGLKQHAALSIYGFLQLAEATRLSPAEAGTKFQQFVENEQASGRVRARALDALHALKDPRFGETLKNAAASSNEVLSQAANNLKKEIEEGQAKEATASDRSQPPSEKAKAEALEAVHDRVIGSIRGMLGWRYAFFVPAGALFLIWLLFILLQRNRPEDVGLPSIEEYHGEKVAVIEDDDTPEEEPDGSWTVVWEVITSPMVILLAAVYFFLKPTRYLVLFSSPLYVKEQLHTGSAESGMLGAMFDLAGPIGVLFGGYVSDKVFRSRRMPMSVLALIGLAVLLFFFRSLPASRLALGLGFFGIGFLLYIPDSLVSATAAIDFGTKKGASTAAGMINGCGSIGAILGGTMPGWIASLSGKGPHVWQWIFWGLSASTVVAALLLLPRWNTLPPEAKSNGK